MVHSIPASSSFNTTSDNSNYYYSQNEVYPSYYQYPVQSVSVPDYEDGGEQPRKMRRYSMPVSSHPVMHTNVSGSVLNDSTPTSSSTSWMYMSPTSSHGTSPTNDLRYSNSHSKPQKRNYLSSPTSFSLNLNLQSSSSSIPSTVNSYENSMVNKHTSALSPIDIIDDDLQFEDSVEAGDLSPPSSPTLSGSSSTSGINKSAIECGNIDSRTGNRVFTIDSDYFEKNVEIYVAANDPQRRVLYRASALAEKFGCATNKVGMYLSRRRNSEEGLYQASGFLYKPPGRSGLKSGGYFLSMEVCQGFEEHYCRQSHRQKVRQLRRQQATANLRANAALLSSTINSSSNSSDSVISLSRNNTSTSDISSSKSFRDGNHTTNEEPSSKSHRTIPVKTMRKEYTELSDCSVSSVDNTPLQSPVSPVSAVSSALYPTVRCEQQPRSYSYPQSHSLPSSYAHHEFFQPQQQMNPSQYSSYFPMTTNDSQAAYDSTMYTQQYDSVMPLQASDCTNVKMEDNATYFDDFGVQPIQPETDYFFGILY
jgi:hypothetical protein